MSRGRQALIAEMQAQIVRLQVGRDLLERLDDDPVLPGQFIRTREQVDEAFSEGSIIQLQRAIRAHLSVWESLDKAAPVAEAPLDCEWAFGLTWKDGVTTWVGRKRSGDAALAPPPKS